MAEHHDRFDELVAIDHSLRQRSGESWAMAMLMRPLPLSSDTYGLLGLSGAV